MKKLDKETIAERDSICSRLRDAFDKANAAIEELNAAIIEKWDEVEEAVSSYNEAVSEADSWKESVASDIQSYMDDRSEKWQEGDKAQAYTSWKEAFEDTFDAFEIEQPNGLDPIDEGLAELLEQLPEEVEA